jgi:hypothetical protein
MKVQPGTNVGVAADVFVRIVNDAYLYAKGTAQDQIVFALLPANGLNWGGFVFSSQKDKNRLEWVQVLKAGNKKAGYGMEKSAAVGVDNNQMAWVALKNTMIKGSQGYGLYIEKGASLSEFTSNSFEDNEGPIIALSVNLVNILQDAAIYSNGNTRNTVEIFESNLNHNVETIWGPLPYNIGYYLPNGMDLLSGLKLKPGVKLVFGQNALLNVLNSGYLHAVGNGQDGSVVFQGAVEQPGYWRGVAIKSNNIQNVMEGCKISYAGSSAMPGMGNTKASIAVYAGGTGRLMIRNSVIEKSSGWGIAVEESFGAIINEDAETVNQFKEVTDGKVKKM